VSNRSISAALILRICSQPCSMLDAQLFLQPQHIPQNALSQLQKLIAGLNTYLTQNRPASVI